MRQDTVAPSKIRYIRPRKRRRAAPVFGLWLFLLCCCLLAAYFFINSAYFSLERIEVSGNKTLTEEQIVELSGIGLGTNIFRIDSGSATQKIILHPSVKEVKVSRRLPNALLFTITERQPKAMIVSQDGFIAVDEETVYLQKVNDLQSWPLPLISGIKIDPNKRPGAKLETEGLKAALQLIRMLDKDFLSNVAEIIAPSSLSLTLKTVQGVEVRFGEPRELERKIKLMQSLIFENGAIINSDTVEYIDLRYDTAPVIRRKN